jgi:hypothetical protein
VKDVVHLSDMLGVGFLEPLASIETKGCGTTHLRLDVVLIIFTSRCLAAKYLCAPLVAKYLVCCPGRSVEVLSMPRGCDCVVKITVVILFSVALLVTCYALQH